MLSREASMAAEETTMHVQVAMWVPLLPCWLQFSGSMLKAAVFGSSKHFVIAMYRHFAECLSAPQLPAMRCLSCFGRTTEHFFEASLLGQRLSKLCNVLATFLQSCI